MPGDTSISAPPTPFSCAERGQWHRFRRFRTFSAASPTAPSHPSAALILAFFSDVNVTAPPFSLNRPPACVPQSQLPRAHAGNSGTTIRLLFRNSAGQNFKTNLSGTRVFRTADETVVGPLREWARNQSAATTIFAPLEFRGGKLRASNTKCRMATRSKIRPVLLSGLFLPRRNIVTETGAHARSPNSALEEFGAPVELNSAWTKISRRRLELVLIRWTVAQISKFRRHFLLRVVHHAAASRFPEVDF